MQKQMNIFLVEDNDLDVELLKRGLKKLDIAGDLIRAKDGIDALELLRADQLKTDVRKPYLILLDINMPRMNGHEFLESLRNSEDLRHARVIVFTTSDSPRDVNLAYHQNATGYVVKPNSSSELKEVLSTIQQFWSVCEPSESRTQNLH